MTQSRLWTVTLKALAGPDPLGGKELTAMEETLDVQANNKLEVKEKSLLMHKMKLRGHEVQIRINGEQYFDPRF